MLSSPDPVLAFGPMQAKGLMPHVVAGWRHIGQGLPELSRMVELTPNPERRLIALIDSGIGLSRDEVGAVQNRMRFSQAIAARIVAAGQALHQMQTEDDLRKVAHMILTRCGYEVVQCDNGQDAVRIYQSLFRTGTPPDVVLMDLTLRGGMNGTETAAEILHLDPDARVVCTSGSVTEEVQMVFLERGFVGVLPKPYEAGELTQVVHRVSTMMKRH